MSALPPQDAAIRQQALDPSRSFIVEAPAGSGKTELLTRRYLKLLTTVSAPEEILAITFTRKAASEMRERVLKAMAMAQHPAPEKSSLKYAVWELACEVAQQDEHHGWQLLSHPARLRIMTIDAFNLFLTRQLPMISGAGAALPIANDPQALYADVVLRLIERLGGNDAHADAIEQLLRHLDNRYSQFESLLSQELVRREHWLELGLMRFDLPSLRERLEATLRAVVEDTLSELHRCIPVDVHNDLVTIAAHAADVLYSSDPASPIVACRDVHSLPAASGDALAIWQGIAELLLTKDGTWRVQINKRIGILPEHKPQKLALQELLQTLQRQRGLEDQLHLARSLPPTRYSDEQWRVLSELLVVLKLAIAELELVMRERNAADYPANSISARRALGSVIDPTDLALRLDYRLKHLLIDEFQDTSRGQVELLALLTAGWVDGDGRSLFCVGDPMQSIYRFRNADVGLFLTLKRQGLNQLRLEPLRLEVNFRSNAPVLDWINKTFALAFPKIDDPARGAVGYTSSVTRQGATQEGEVVMHPLFGDAAIARLEEAQCVVDLIVQKQATQPDCRIAVLASSRSHLQRIIAELNARNLAFQAVEIDALAKRPAILDLLALTRAIVHLADRTAWLSVLRAPWCGLSLADLHALAAEQEGEASSTLWQLVNLATQSLSADGRNRLSRCIPVLTQAIERRGRMPLRNCIEGTWQALGGPATLKDAAALQDCAMYFTRLEQLERCGDLEDVAQLESHLQDLFAAGDAAHAEGESKRTGSIELMTVHRAKGLEFDVVILPALDAGVRRDDSPLLRAQELPHIDSDALLLAPIAPSGGEPGAIYAWLEQLEKDRGRFERGRLLYVAATRAEAELHLFGAVKVKNGAVVKPTANTFLSMLWPVVESEFAAAYAVRDHQALESTPANDLNTLSPIVTLRLPLAWQVPAPQFTEQMTAPRVIEDAPLHPEFEWAGETARHIGTVVHREIEYIARVGVQRYATSISSQRGSDYLTQLAELGIPQALRDAAAQRVADAIGKMLNDKRGCWLLAGNELHREADSEFALSGVLDGNLVNGIIDRTFVDSDGMRWVVDFKTSTHEGGGLEQFLDREVERYRPQLSRYQRLLKLYRPHESIKTALYFPLLGAWREVGV